jgi:lipoprotein-anchoring transpeptidase ErfK/SrfK
MLPVTADRGDWLKVRLPSRPNGQEAWVRTTDVTLTETPYRIVINLGARRLHLLRLGHEILDAPAGVGTATDPTPTGEYFVALFEKAPSAGYGPFVMVTSDHSNTITDWEQSGDAVIAIHGPLGASAEIGTHGAAISHGCVRLQNTDLAQLRPVPAGTPITITA